MDKPVLTRMQRAWLQEIGIDARMLAHFSAEPYAQEAEKPVASAAPDATSVDQEVTQSPAMLTPATTAAVEATQDKESTPSATLIAELLKRTPLPQQPAAASAASDAPSTRLSPPEMDSEATTLQSLRAQTEQCQACGLHEVRGRAVFGEGAEAAPQWMFVGEAPGEYDDSIGRPFQGRAGELLRAMLRSIGMPEDGPAYFTNVLKCRPMGNRSPQAAEIAACMPLLRRQIQLLRPGCLVALGRVSASALLGRDDDLDLLRGQVHNYIDEDGRSIPLVVTHHPASLLLHGQLKAEAWRDLNLLADVHQRA